MSHITLGSLFDGSGGFPLAASLCGITPVLASEIEPYPIAVTTSRFPNMHHYGDVSKINGAEIEPVDVMTFGSPCQDLSVAGKRAGLKHEANGDEETTRSGLFMEAVRIIKEMREATNGKHPRFALWENVPGAFSSNKGEDFRVVCEELIKIAEPAALMPPVPKNGWAYADSHVGDGWSLAYRVFDAQYWGVPQRRRRIHLVVDFGGECAREVLFEREGVRGYFAEGRTPWKGLAADAEGGTGAANREGEGEIGRLIQPIAISSKQQSLVTSVNVANTLGANDYKEPQAVCCCAAAQNEHHLFQPMSIRDENWSESDVKNAIRAGESKSSHCIVDMNILDDQGGSQISVRADGKSPTLRAEMHGNVPCVLEAGGFKELNSAKARSDGYGHEVAPCLSANKHDACVCIKEQHLFENHSQDTRYKGPLDVSPMLPAQLGTGGNNTPFVVEETAPAYCLQGSMIGRADMNGPQGDGVNEEACFTLNTIDRHAIVYAKTYQKVTGPLMANSHPGSYSGQDAYSDMLIVGEQQPVCYRQGGFADYVEGEVGTLRAAGGDFGGDSENIIRTQYIVRRLTPTECARLQGFADWWSYIEPKETLTDAEYEFWLNVRNTHAEINGKTVKSYTKDQMLTWYNKLHTDSSEYKMWGNGIALPTALYVMQGIKDALSEDRHGTG